MRCFITSNRHLPFVIALMLILGTRAGVSQSAAACPGVSQQGQEWRLLDKSASNRVCLKPGVEWGKYRRIQLEESSYEPGNSANPLKAPEAKALVAYFDVRLRSAYGDNNHTNHAELKIVPVISDIRRSRPLINLIGFALAPVPLTYGGASVRFDLIDAKSGETIGVVTGRRRGRPWNIFQSLTSLGHARVVLDSSAKRLKQDTDRVASEGL